MANQKHLAILKQRVEEWNQWRKEYPEIEPNLSGANLSIDDASDDDFYGTSIIKTDLKKDFLSGVNLSNADLVLQLLLHFS